MNAANLHYAIVVAAGTPLAEVLGGSFGVGGGEAEAFRELAAETESRRSWKSLFLPNSLSHRDLESIFMHD